MQMVGIHPAAIFGCGVFVIGWLLPVVLGFTVVREDAERHGQPGWLWGLLTIPFGWLAILIYAIMRAALGGPRV